LYVPKKFERKFSNMKFKAYNDDVYSIISQRAGALSQKYYHTFCGTSHLFLAILSFLRANKDSNERYNKIFTGLKEILNKYNITGSSFETSFLEFCPQGVEPESGSSFTITADEEFSIITQNLSRNAVKLQRSMEIEDLIVELFGDPNYSVFTIFSDITKSEAKTEEMRNAIIQKFKKAVIPEIKELEEIPELTNLNTWVKENPQTVIDSDDEIKKIEMGLAGRSIKNVCLTGKAGTGKTTYVYEFVQRIVNGDVPEQFKDKIVYELSSTALVAGTRYRGDMEEKLMNILNIVKKNSNVILFVDELHSMMEAGSGSDGSQSAGQLLKPFLTRGDIQMIGATTHEEYTKYLLKDKAFASRFHEVKIEEPSRKAVKAILEGLLPVEK
jgi:ATP-dependent Clp protease ATP-binding subunit ClpA